MIEETKKAADLILKAVVATRMLYSDSKQPSDINPVDEMSRDIGNALAHLIADEDEQCHADVDWGANLFDWIYFMKQLSILIAKPGVLDKLPAHYREEASLRISKLRDFFSCINDERHTNEWLTWLMLTDFDQTQDTIDRKEAYYDFETRNIGHGNFFRRHEVDKYRKMEQLYPEVQHLENLNHV